MKINNLKDIQGKVVKKNRFSGFIIQEALLEYDGPRLLVAISPKKESWLFKWCDTDESSQIERWIAFKVSNARLESLKNNEISLREAVTLPEEEFYVLDTKKLFEPLRTIISVPEKIPIDYFPSDDIALNGTSLSLNPVDSKTLTVRLHVFSELIKDGTTPLPLMSGIQSNFQQYMSWTAHSINRTPKGRVPTPFKDWSGFNLTLMEGGSLKMECVSNSDQQETEKLVKACELFSDLSNGVLNVQSVEKEFGRGFGKNIIDVSVILTQFISRLNLSFSMKWASSQSNGYLAIDKRRADNFLNSLIPREELGPSREITIHLTPNEAKPLRKKVKKGGGMQDLLINLQSKLTDQNTITLSPEEIEKILRYGLNYGQGGWQDRLVGIAMALKRIGIPFNTA
jgi:hypothetical protein